MRSEECLNVSLHLCGQFSVSLATAEAVQREVHPQIVSSLLTRLVQGLDAIDVLCELSRLAHGAEALDELLAH